MNSELWQQVRELFHGAMERSHEERAAYLDQACSNPDVRQEVESLLRFHDQDSQAMERSAVGLLTRSVADAEHDRWIGNRIGPYQVIAKIGEGGMGSVYRAVRVEEQYLKQVAIKVVRTGLSSDHYLRRFRNERQIMASLDHPNIAHLLDGGATDDGTPYFVMEYIEGRRIDAYCDELKLATTARLQLFLEVCGAVQYAHQHLIVHRDLKPGNILITAKGHPKLLDFGIAKLLEPELFLQTTDVTATLMKPMTPEYASPEQIQGEPVTTVSDVYSLGVLLYRLLTGHAPYRVEGQPLHELARTISESEPARPSLVIDRVEEETSHDGATIKLTPEYVSGTRDGEPQVLRHRLAGDLDNILLKALRKEPARRYVSVEQFAEDVRRHLDGMPVLARKDTIRYRTAKFIKRHRIGVAAAVLLAATLVGGIVATSWQAHIARQQRHRAEQRFNDVRQLANALIFDVDGAIADLPGSTSARQLLVKNAVQYLDRLAGEAKDDQSLQRELATAYTKLADVQGNPFHANLGDTGGALENYRKVTTIWEQLSASNPQDRDTQFSLAMSYRWLGQMLVSTGDLQGGLANASKALAIMEPLVRADPQNVKLLDQIENVYELIGDIYGGNGLSANLGDPVVAVENHRKALASAETRVRVNPNNPSARNGVAMYNIKIGDDLLKLGDRTAALKNYDVALQIYTPLAATPAGARYARNLHILYERIGNAYLIAGDARQALTAYRTSMAVAEKLAAADPQNALAKEDVATGYALIGKSLAQSGQAKLGLETLSRSITLMEDEVAHDPRQTNPRRILGLLYIWRAEILASSGSGDQALADERKSEALFQAIATADPKDVESMVSLAATRAKIATLLARKESSSAAMDLFQNALSLVEPLSRTEPPNPQAQYTVADIYEGIARLHERTALAGKGGPTVQLASWKEARSWYEKSSLMWGQVKNPGKLSPSGFDAGNPAQVTAKLAACDAAIAKLQTP
jgi:eukaryotic-like serine/threonine-protein kinase